MTYLEKMKKIAIDPSKPEQTRFLDLCKLGLVVREQQVRERCDSTLPRTVSRKERLVADLIKELSFIPGKYPGRVPDEKWSSESPLLIAGILEFIDSLYEDYSDAKLPLVDQAREAMFKRRNSLWAEGYFDEAEAYDWNTPEGNDGY